MRYQKSTRTDSVSKRVSVSHVTKKYTGWVFCDSISGLWEQWYFHKPLWCRSACFSQAQPRQGLLAAIFQLSRSPWLLSHRLSDRFQFHGTCPPRSYCPAPTDRFSVYSICLWHGTGSQGGMEAGGLGGRDWNVWTREERQHQKGSTPRAMVGHQGKQAFWIPITL